MAGNPIRRALQQADAITSGNEQLERLTRTGNAGPGPLLFNDRRQGPMSRCSQGCTLPNQWGKQERADHEAMHGKQSRRK